MILRDRIMPVFNLVLPVGLKITGTLIDFQPYSLNRNFSRFSDFDDYTVNDEIFNVFTFLH